MRWIRPVAQSAGLTILTLAAAVGLHVGWLQASGNVHEVIAGELYRSATLPPDRLTKLIADKGIRTIISLRGGAEDAPWRRAESEAAKAAGVGVVNFAWPVTRQLTDADVEAFFAAAGASPKPILIHCRAGADRTGLAVALYLAKFKGADEASAERQLSVLYGHFGGPLSRAYPMDQTFERLEAGLGYPGS